MGNGKDNKIRELNKTALVTGGAGFIGSYILPALQETGYSTRSIDLLPPSPLCISAQTEYIENDITNYTAMLKAVKGTDLVVHLAAKHRFFGISEEDFRKTNVTGTEVLLRAMTEHKVNKLIFYSSVAVYGDQSRPTDENTPPAPSAIYGATKLEGEELIQKWVSESSARRAIIIRPTVVFGPRNKGNMFRLIRQVDKRLFVPVGGGENIKSVAYVDNLIDATIFLLKKISSGVSIYNYADEPHLTFRSIVKQVYTGLGFRPPRYCIPSKPILVVLKPVDYIAGIIGISFPISAAIAKMNKMTHHTAAKVRHEGFVQSLSIDEGIERMAKWYLTEKNAYKKEQMK